jgi:hypothetical protein
MKTSKLKLESEFIPFVLELQIETQKELDNLKLSLRTVKNLFASDYDHERINNIKQILSTLNKQL